MRNLVVGAFAILAAAVVASSTGVKAEQAAPAAAPTFTKDIAPIFYAN